jgi:hypothetical protein
VSIRYRYSGLLVLCAPVFDLSFTHDLLGSLPVPHFERLAYFLAAQKAIYPDGTLAMAILSALRPMLAAVPVSAINREHLTLLEVRGLGCKAIVDSLQDRLWNAKSEVAPFAAWVPVSDCKYTGLMLKDLAPYRAQVPHLRDLDDRVVTLGGYNIFLLR